MHTSKVVRAFLGMLAYIVTPLIQAQDGYLIVSSRHDGNLILTGKQENAYKNILFKDKNGVVHKLFDGRYTYEDEGSRALSPDRRFYMVTQNESGVAISGSGVAKDHQVSSCVFIDTNNGCVVKREVGEYCGGAWSGGHDWPRLNGDMRPINSSVPSATDLLRDYGNSIQKKKDIKSFIRYSVAFDNIISCDAINSANKDAYSKIADALEESGDTEDAGKIKKALQMLEK